MQRSRVEGRNQRSKSFGSTSNQLLEGSGTMTKGVALVARSVPKCAAIVSAVRSTVWTRANKCALKSEKKTMAWVRVAKAGLGLHFCKPLPSFTGALFRGNHNRAVFSPPLFFSASFSLSASSSPGCWL
jgi:hypothetical protein